ncbi:uncharacterized protein LOC129565993 [Sitodiplosis mosellana]|uniref:uncharacterized protein LOC129565993 n=1 Tax=Sitodiplosis mosellana TaxID=263140 RepID=UPI002444A868|nr:uncharacterized protein LOC129565993 [Sitodiplosis mosellana]
MEFKLVFRFSIIFLLFSLDMYAISVSTRSSKSQNQSPDGRCILVTVCARLNVTYPTKHGKPQTEHNYKIPINNKQYYSSCSHDETYQEISIQWIDKDKNLYNTMNLTFYLNDATKTFTLGAIAFQLAAEIFPSGSYDWFELFYFGNTLSAPFGNSYQCGRIKSLPLRLKNDKNITGMVELTNIQFEAYRNGKRRKFSTPKNCEMNEKPKTSTEGTTSSEDNRLAEHQTSTEGESHKSNGTQISNNSTRDIAIIISVVIPFILVALIALVYFIYLHRCNSTTADKKKLYKVKCTESNEKLWL